MQNKFYKNKKTDKVSWVDNNGQIGVWLFSFDEKEVFNLFADYPDKLTPEQKEIFDKENPEWVKFFAERQ